MAFAHRVALSLAANLFILVLNDLQTNQAERTHLDGLDEGEEEDPDADAPPEQLDESGRSEEPQEADVDQLGGVDDAAQHRDEVERVPGVLEVGLEQGATVNKSWAP